jgi:UDP-N-acetylmuramate--alanine ligase
MNLENIHKIHFIGIGGIYTSALAMLLVRYGKDVSGCDVYEPDEAVKLLKMGIEIEIGHNASHITGSTDLVVFTSAIDENNPEYKIAKQMNIKMMSVYQLLGELSKDMVAITVSGTKGKTSTTAMTGLILKEAQMDPTVVVGGKVKDFEYGNLQVGNSEYIVMEGCEFKAQMLELHPNITVITNIEADHLDYYKDIDHIIETFKKYTAKIPKDGFLIINGDELNCHKLGCCGGSLVTYGIDNESDIMAKNIIVKDNKQTFDLYVDGRMVAEIALNVPGKYNIYNALGAISVAVQLEVKFETIKIALEKFQGSWRRFEKLGEVNGATIISDYAHTPTSVKNVIKATKEFYPGKRIIAVFQPHLHSRTKKLFNEFAESFTEADLAIISDIYFVAGRVDPKDQDVTSEQLAVEAGKLSEGKVFYGGNLENTKKMILEKIEKDDIVLIIGAGDVYKIGEEMVSP